MNLAKKPDVNFQKFKDLQESYGSLIPEMQRQLTLRDLDYKNGLQGYKHQLSVLKEQLTKNALFDLSHAQAFQDYEKNQRTYIADLRDLNFRKQINDKKEREHDKTMEMDQDKIQIQIAEHLVS